jgi:glutamyl-tRNA reductase
MSRELIVVGLSWRTAPVSVRERLAFPDAEIADALGELIGSDDLAEAVILSTCNRVEVYAATPRAAPASARETAAARVRSYLARSRGIHAEELADHIYEHGAGDAVRHIFKVAASLDSMVVGESQILGQLKAAYGRSVGAGATGAVLSRCLERSFRVAKRVRSETEIARGAANISSVAVELAVRVFGELAGKSVLLLGAGKMSALAARHLRSSGANQILVSNRSPERAAELAAEVEGEARAWEQLADLLAASDVVISSTGSKQPILTRKLLKQAVKKRRYRPLLIVDIAVPRDAEAAVASLDGVYLFDIDDLEKVVAENLRLRGREASAGLQIIEAEALDFESWMRGQTIGPTIAMLRRHFIAVANAEAERAAAALARAQDPAEREELARRLADRIAKKLLHAPMMALKSDGVEDVAELARLARTLFDLEGAADGETEPVRPVSQAQAAKKAE